MASRQKEGERVKEKQGRIDGKCEMRKNRVNRSSAQTIFARSDRLSEIHCISLNPDIIMLP